MVWFGLVLQRQCVLLVAVVAAQSEETLTNGDVTLENGSGDSEKPVKRQDVILILGKAENCEGAKQALLVRPYSYS